MNKNVFAGIKQAGNKATPKQIEYIQQLCEDLDVISDDFYIWENMTKDEASNIIQDLLHKLESFQTDYRDCY